MPPTISPDDLIDRYDGFLLDAYGVLVTSRAAIPGAAAFLRVLRTAGKKFVVLTNDSSRLPETSRDSYLERGVDIGDATVVTSGSLLSAYFEEHQLDGATCCVLGPPDSVEYARRAGGNIVGFGDHADVVVVGDEAGFDFLPAVDAVLSMIVRRSRAGEPPRLVLPNPDRIYPKGDGDFGVASGAIAAMLEASLQAAFGDDAPRFERLGKPFSPIYEVALTELGLPRDRVVMVGDQLETDIRGANAVGIDSALASTGVAVGLTHVEPTWLLAPFEG